MARTHFTAWLVNDRSCLETAYMDVTILEDDLIGDPEDDGAWASNGNNVFYALTTVDAEDGDDDDACDQARDLMENADWRLVGDWAAVDTGYIVTVERA